MIRCVNKYGNYEKICIIYVLKSAFIVLINEIVIFSPSRSRCINKRAFVLIPVSGRRLSIGWRWRSAR